MIPPPLSRTALFSPKQTREGSRSAFLIAFNLLVQLQLDFQGLPSQAEK